MRMNDENSSAGQANRISFCQIGRNTECVYRTGRGIEKVPTVGDQKLTARIQITLTTKHI